MRVKRQRMPAGRSRSKSSTQVRGSAQRPVPGCSQSRSKGGGRRGSPSATMGALNRAVTCRTPLTVPCGEKDSTRSPAPSVAPAREEDIQTNTSGSTISSRRMAFPWRGCGKTMVGASAAAHKGWFRRHAPDRPVAGRQDRENDPLRRSVAFRPPRRRRCADAGRNRRVRNRRYGNRTGWPLCDVCATGAVAAVRGRSGCGPVPGD